MEYKTNFFKKAITSIYDIKVFSNYAKEGIFRSISYAMLLTLILVGINVVFTLDKINNYNLKSFIDTIITSFAVRFFNLLFNCLIVVLIASIFTIFMKMVVKYMALYSLTLYAATLPLIIQIVLETINPNINFDNMFIVGTLTYVMLILKYIKDEIIKNLN
jgi:hypothetical protein